MRYNILSWIVPERGAGCCSLPRMRNTFLKGKVKQRMDTKQKAFFRTVLIVFMDLVLIAACCGFAFLVRFDFSVEGIPSRYKEMIPPFVLLQSLVTLIIFLLRRMYSYVWRTVSIHDMAGIMFSVVLAFVPSYLAGRLFGMRLPTSVAFIDACLLMFTQVGMRCSLRFYGLLNQVLETSGRNDARIMLIGAGEAGRMLLNEVRSSRKLSGKVCCIIDDNPAKWGKQMNGVVIVGGRDKIVKEAMNRKINQIVFAIPTATAQQKKEILKLCQQTGCKVRSLPGLYQLANGEVGLSAVKDVQVEDLLGRDAVKLDTGAVGDFLRNKVVMVTGGGGSIGSELCRQIAKFHPRQLIILDIYENNAYDIQQELRRRFPGLDLRAEIATIRDKEKTYALVKRYRPDVIFHAAAHKHVPLMENCPEEAIKNNVFGTYHVVRAAEKFGVKKFVMISTDKAVNPTNIMGATKRFCEMILQSRSQSTTEFCAVRFGNVLGSNGSVVPLFKRQIEAGGPITLTDKRIIRYFMTIPEAAQLVLEAGAMAKRGQIFVLDMGEPVKILDLAENLIRLSGLTPYKDIEIQEVGLRPGEKLYEELLMNNDTLSRTANEKIFVERLETIPTEHILSGLKQLDKAVTGGGDKEVLIALMKQLVPTFYDPEEINGVFVPRGMEDSAETEQEFPAAGLAGVGEVD